MSSTPPHLRDPLLIRYRRQILEIARKHGVSSIRVFGSRARGDARDDSDIDLLVESGARRSFFFPGGLIADLEDLLGRRVEITTARALRPDLREQVLHEAVPL
jgi:uncharacterized protein